MLKPNLIDMMGAMGNLVSGSLVAINLEGLIQSGALRLGVCVPSSCSDEDASNGFNNFLNASQLFDNLLVKSQSLACHVEGETVVMDSADWLIMTIVVAFGLLVLIGTAIDLGTSFFLPINIESRSVQNIS